MSLPLILASASPRRRELLTVLGLPFTIKRADIDERQLPNEKPQEMAVRLSLAKACKVAQHRQRGWVIGADTIVVFQGEILGKPTDTLEAAHMLRRMRGKRHTVYSGLGIWDAQTDQHVSDLSATKVWMRDYTESELAAYVATGSPMDKAGAYGIQDEAFQPVARIDGCYASVMGLPLCHLSRQLEQLGLELPRETSEICQTWCEYPCQAYKDIKTQ